MRDSSGAAMATEVKDDGCRLSPLMRGSGAKDIGMGSRARQQRAFLDGMAFAGDGDQAMNCDEVWR
jgi:hypothetical protein